MSTEIRGRSDSELQTAGCTVVHGSHREGQAGFTAQALSFLLQVPDHESADKKWYAMPIQEREALLRLDRWARLLPGLPAGEARTLSIDPSLAVLDRDADRIVLLPERKVQRD